MKPIIGQITNFETSWNSGIATLHITDDEGTEHPLWGDSGSTCRAMDDAFPGFIQAGHTVNPKVIVGQRITAYTDEMGMLAGFSLDE